MENSHKLGKISDFFQRLLRVQNFNLKLVEVFLLNLQNYYQFFLPLQCSGVPMRFHIKFCQFGFELFPLPH